MTVMDHQTVQHFVIEALERTAFVLADPADDVPHENLSRHAKISYSGGQAGAVYVSATDGFLAEVASSLLGVDTSEVHVELEGLDALRELTNIMGGSILHGLGGEASTFRLGLPELLASPPALEGTTVTCAVESEEGQLAVTWCRPAA